MLKLPHISPRDDNTICFFLHNKCNQEHMMELWPAGSCMVCWQLSCTIMKDRHQVFAVEMLKLSNSVLWLRGDLI